MLHGHCGALCYMDRKPNDFQELISKLNENPSQKSSWNQTSLPIYQRSTDSFSTVPPIVYGEDCGRIVGDLETIIVLVLLTFYFIAQKSHHSLTLPRSRIGDSAIVTLTPGDGTIDNKLESSA